MKNGVISVYTAITFSIILSLFISAYEAAKVSAYRVVSECALRSAILSAFAEYNAELFEQYDLLFVDLSYQTDHASLEAMSERIRVRMEENLNPIEEGPYALGADLFGKGEAETVVTDVRMATDTFGAAVYCQAVNYMEDLLSADFIRDLTALTKIQDSYSLTGEDFETEKERVKNTNINILPTPDVDLYFLQPLDLIVLKGDVYNVSGRTFNPLDVPSARTELFQESDGLKAADPSDPLSDLYFTEYCIQKSGNYSDPKENSFLRYEAEYLIAGTPSDSANLSAVIHMIFGIRTLANAVSVKKDSEKMAIIKVLAVALSAVTRADPETIESVIVFLWAAAEATYDAEDLLSGKKVELIKDTNSFHTTLADGVAGLLGAGASFSVLADAGMGSFTAGETGLGEYSSGGQSVGSSIKLSYEDYLRLLLLGIPGTVKTVRMLDVMELDIRQTGGNEYFRMDCCLDAATVFATVSASFGAKYRITGSYSYD